MAQDTVVVAQHVRTQTSKLEQASSATELRRCPVSTRSPVRRMPRPQP
jgi:hypothetical protein